MKHLVFILIPHSHGSSQDENIQLFICPLILRGKKKRQQFRNFPQQRHAALTRCPYYLLNSYFGDLQLISLFNSTYSTTQHFLLSSSSKLYSRSFVNLLYLKMHLNTCLPSHGKKYAALLAKANSLPMLLMSSSPPGPPSTMHQ